MEPLLDYAGQRGQVCITNHLQSTLFSTTLAYYTTLFSCSVESLSSNTMAGKPHAPRNKMLAGGISLYSRSAMYKRKALYKKKKTVVKPTKEKRPYYKLKDIKGEKNGNKRVVLLKKTVGLL